MAIVLLPKKPKLKRKRSKWAKNCLDRQIHFRMRLINELTLELDNYRNQLYIDENTYTVTKTSLAINSKEIY